MRSACLFEESMGSSAARTGITAPARKVLPPHEKCFQVAYQTKNRPKFKAVCFLISVWELLPHTGSAFRLPYKIPLF